MLDLILLVLAFVLALIASFENWWWRTTPAWGPPHLGWLALAFFFLSVLLSRKLGF